MVNEVQSANKLLNLIELTVSKLLPKYKDEGNLNYLEEGIVKELLDNGTRCNIEINGTIKNLPILEGSTISVGNVGMVLIWNYNKNKRIVIGKRPSKW